MTVDTGFFSGSTEPASRARGVILQPQPTNCIELSSGHRIAYQEYGKSAGFPMFYFHDSGSSRLECTFFHGAAKAFGYRLIAIDRPGIGCSDYYDQASPETVANDVAELAGWLKIDQFAVLSLGSGGIFALMLAFHHRRRVTEVLSLGGVPGSSFRESNPGASLGRYWQQLTPSVIKFWVRAKHAFNRDNSLQAREHLSQILCDADRRALQESRTRNILDLDQQEVMRQGARGLAQDIANCYRKLDFTLDDLQVPVTIWQGKSDNLSQRTDCEFMLSRIPSARYFRVPNRGHFFFLGGMDSVFSRMHGHKPSSVAFAA